MVYREDVVHGQGLQVALGALSVELVPVVVPVAVPVVVPVAWLQAVASALVLLADRCQRMMRSRPRRTAMRRKSC